MSNTGGSTYTEDINRIMEKNMQHKMGLCRRNLRLMLVMQSNYMGLQHD